MRDRVFCKLKTAIDEPPMIYGFLDRESKSPDMVYCLNEQGYIMRGNQQRPMTVGEMTALDAEAERCAKSYREEHKLDLIVV